MLEDTFHRAEKLIPSDRLFTVVSQDHLKYSEVRQQLSSRPRGTVVVQPENKETGPGLLLPLMRVYSRYPESTVVVFPSDHVILEEDLFISYVDLACRAVERDPTRLILLGVEPTEPEREYGYILPGSSVKTLAPLNVLRVLQFVEKPDSHAVPDLIVKGGLWNTMIMVFKARTLLEMVRRTVPRLFEVFGRIASAIGTSSERNVVEKTYREIEPLNFSKGLLETFPQKRPGCLLTLPVRGVSWSDWGSEARVISMLRRTGRVGRLNGITEDELFRIS